MADPGNEGNKIIVGLPDRLDKYKTVIRQYQSRETAIVLLTAALHAGLLEVPTFINEVQGILETPVKVDPPVEDVETHIVTDPATGKSLVIEGRIIGAQG
jgi:hypothetical protein